MVDEHWISLHRAGDIRTDTLRIGVHRSHLSAYSGAVITEEDCVAEALAHLRETIRTYQRRNLPNHRLRNYKYVAVEIIESSGDLTCQLDMRCIVLPDGNHTRVHA